MAILKRKGNRRRQNAHSKTQKTPDADNMSTVKRKDSRRRQYAHSKAQRRRQEGHSKTQRHPTPTRCPL